MQSATIAVVGLTSSDDVVGVLQRAGYRVLERTSVTDVDVRGPSAQVAVLARWPVRQVG